MFRTKKSKKNTDLSKGHSVIEVMLAVTIFLMFAGVFMTALITSQKANIVTNKRTQASSLAEEGLEAARSIRDRGYEELSVGEHGLDSSGAQWELTAAPDNINGFDRTLTVEEIEAGRKRVESEVQWQQRSNRKSSLMLAVDLCDWKGGAVMDCASYCQDQGYADGICRRSTWRCDSNGETNETEGDQYCDAGDVCCCSTEEIERYESCQDYCQNNGYGDGGCTGFWSCIFGPGTWNNAGDVYCSGSVCCCQ